MAEIIEFALIHCEPFIKKNEKTIIVIVIKEN
jgi:hypothetical protein